MHLPRTHAVTHGEVIDLAGNRSRQCDVIITNEDQPLGIAGNDNGAGLYIIEGVSAVGEIKARLTCESFADAIEKGRQLKRLRANEPPSTELFGALSDARRFGSSPPYFLLAYEASISEDAFRELRESVPMVRPARTQGQSVTPSSKSLRSTQYSLFAKGGLSSTHGITRAQ